jgi:hypothetical protein
MRLSLPRALFRSLVSMLVQSTANAQANAIPSAPIERAALSAGIESSSQAGGAPSAKSPQANLTLADAEARALKNEPRLLAEQFRAQAANKRVTESRSGYFPQAFGGSPLSMPTEIVLSPRGRSLRRVSPLVHREELHWFKMITDFGHTSNLLQSARFQVD